MWLKPQHFFPVYVALGAHCIAPSQLTISFKKLLLGLPAIPLLFLLLPLNAVSVAVSRHHFAVAIPTLLNTSQHSQISAPLGYSYIRCGPQHRTEP